MVQPPKELPSIHNLPKPMQFPSSQNNPVTLRNEIPSITLPPKPQTQIVREVPATQEIVITTTDNSKNYASKPRESEIFSFDEAIKSIHKEITQTSSSHPAPVFNEKKKENEEYYAPKNLGEGYFAQIQQYLQSKDPADLADDILKKDFLIGMKDYHNQKQEGKPFYLHKNDLLEKLEQRVIQLAQKEQEWHSIKNEIEELEKRKVDLEKDIDKEALELKELFILVKTDQILNVESDEKEQFSLRSGQKIKSLNELRKALSYLSDEEFDSYTKEKNHIANWTENSLKMPAIALKIKEAKTKQQLEKFLSKPINI